MKNVAITRLVTGFSWEERRIKQPARAGFVKAVGSGLPPFLYVATKPKASLAGFFMGGRNTPQSGLANGPTWAALKKHRHCIHPQARRPAFLSGTEQGLGITVETGPFRLNDSLKGLWLTEQDSVSGSGKESSDSTLARPMENRMDNQELIDGIDKLRRELKCCDTQATAITWMAKAHELLGIAATKIENTRPVESLIYLPKPPRIESLESGLSPVRLFDVPTYVVPDMKPLYHRVKNPQDLRPVWLRGETVVYGDKYQNQAWTRKDTRRLVAEIKARDAK